MEASATSALTSGGGFGGFVLSGTRGFGAKVPRLISRPLLLTGSKYVNPFTATVSLVNDQ